MNIKEFKTLELKNFLNASSCRMRWHNKNKNGGNFGLNMIGVKGKDWELWCDYDKTGDCHFMRVGPIFYSHYDIVANDFEELKNKIFNYIYMRQ